MKSTKRFIHSKRLLARIERQRRRWPWIVWYEEIDIGPEFIVSVDYGRPEGSFEGYTIHPPLEVKVPIR